MKLLVFVVSTFLATLLSSSVYALNCAGLTNWTTSAQYAGGQKVKHNCEAFEAAYWSSGAQPSQRSGPYEEWKRLGRCDSCGGSSTSSSGGSSGGTSSGSCPSWQAGRDYAVGAIVRYQGSHYIAVHANPGYDPLISTWFWDPTSRGCDGSSSSSSGGGSSSSGSSSGGSSSGGSGGSCPAWVAGNFYNAGDIVTYQGGRYIAEHANPGYDPLISTWYWDPTSRSCGGSSSSSSGGGSSSSSSSGGSGTFVVSENQFNTMFPARNPFYTYRGLVNALSAYPAFAKTGSVDTQKREAAAFLANVGHETGDLVYIREINTANHDSYCDSNYARQSGFTANCDKGGVHYQYFGRGPIQLSWNFNYGAAGAALGIDLLHDPDLVARDPAVAMKTGIWYWMTQSGPGRMTPHAAMTSGAGFGETIRSINGALECDGKIPAKVQARVNRYVNFVQILGTSVGPGATGC